jgi:hypothetical protein
LVRVAQADEAWAPPVLDARISFNQYRKYFYLLRADGSVWHVKPRRQCKYEKYKPYINELLHDAWQPHRKFLCDKIKVDYCSEQVSPVILVSNEADTAPVNRRALDLLQCYAGNFGESAAPGGDCILYLHVYKLNK